MVSPRFEMDDPQDHGEREVWFCTGDGAQDSGLGGAFGQPLATEADAESAEQGQENSDNGRENALLPFKFCNGVEQLLAILVWRFDRDDRSKTASAPSGRGGARDPDVLGQASGAGLDHLVPKTVVVRVTRP